MKTIKLLPIFCFLFSISFANGQNSINGKVQDPNGSGIFFATIGLHNVSDSLLAKAISTEENGSFNIKEINEGEYYMTVTMLGFDSYTESNISFPSDNNKSFIIEMSESTQLLEGVEIKARVPLLEQKSDRLVVNVANNMTSMNNSLLDVMKQVPGMIVTGGKMRMAGQSNITILINGKSTRYMDMESLLRDMPGSNIQKVEVIHQPGAEFEASGTGPVINIIMKKNTLYGTNGSVYAGLGKGRNWRYKTGLNFSHYQGKLNINGGIGFRDDPNLDELILSRRIDGDVYDQRSVDPNFSKSFRTNLSLDYNLTEKHRIGIASRYIINNRDNVVDNTTKINYMDESVDDIDLITKNAQDNRWNLISVNPYYTYEIDTAGQKLELDYSFANFKKDGLSTLTNTVQNIDFNFPGQQFIQLGDTKIMAAKLDYTKPINNNITVSFGSKYSSADLDNDFQAYDENEEQQYILNTGQSNNFLLKETIIGIYGKTTWKYKKWSGTAGLRYEDSKTEGRSVQVDTVLTRDIEKFFPSLSLQREISGPLKAAVAYSYRIDRPRYSSLNPFRFYLDPFTFERGNPNLQPALTHSMKFNLIYENTPFFNVEYKETEDAMVDVLEQDNSTGQTNQVRLNLDKFRTFNTMLLAPLDFIPKVSGYVGGIANYSIFESPVNDVLLERDRWTFTGFASVEFKLPWDINTEVSGWYNSGELDGVITGSWLYGVDIGFSKKVLNDKGRISFGVDNIFYRPFYGTVQYSTVDVNIISNWDAPVANLQFSYKFGNQSMKKKSRAGGSGNDIINRAQN